MFLVSAMCISIQHNTKIKNICLDVNLTNYRLFESAPALPPLIEILPCTLEVGSTTTIMTRRIMTPSNIADLEKQTHKQKRQLRITYLSERSGFTNTSNDSLPCQNGSEKKERHDCFYEHSLNVAEFLHVIYTDLFSPAKKKTKKKKQICMSAVRQANRNLLCVPSKTGHVNSFQTAREIVEIDRQR